MSFVMYPDRSSACVLLVCADFVLSEPYEVSTQQVASALCDAQGSHTLISSTFWTFRLADKTVMTYVTNGARKMPTCLVSKKRSVYVAGPDLSKMVEACCEVLTEAYGRTPEKVETWMNSIRRRAKRHTETGSTSSPIN